MELARLQDKLNSRTYHEPDVEEPTHNEMGDADWGESFLIPPSFPSGLLSFSCP